MQTAASTTDYAHVQVMLAALSMKRLIESKRLVIPPSTVAALFCAVNLLRDDVDCTELLTSILRSGSTGLTFEALVHVLVCSAKTEFAYDVALLGKLADRAVRALEALGSSPHIDLVCRLAGGLAALAGRGVTAPDTLAIERVLLAAESYTDSALMDLNALGSDGLSEAVREKILSLDISTMGPSGTRAFLGMLRTTDEEVALAGLVLTHISSNAASWGPPDVLAAWWLCCSRGIRAPAEVVAHLAKFLRPAAAGLSVSDALLFVSCCAKSDLPLQERVVALITKLLPLLASGIDTMTQSQKSTLRTSLSTVGCGESLLKQLEASAW